MNIAEFPSDNLPLYSSSRPAEKWGIIGGMGPLASAEFIKTIYQVADMHIEQASPVVVLSSDPTIPDRTDILRRQREDVLSTAVANSISDLISLGVSHVAICCVTMHCVVPQLPLSLRGKIVSLLDLCLTAALQQKQRQLLLCSTGTRISQLFENHGSWEDVRDLVVFPNERDQTAIHKAIYEIKRNRLCDEHLEFFKNLPITYGLESYISACTELHIVNKVLASANGRPQSEFCIDPLMMLAVRIANLAHKPENGITTGAACVAGA